MPPLLSAIAVMAEGKKPPECLRTRHFRLEVADNDPVTRDVIMLTTYA